MDLVATLPQFVDVIQKAGVVGVLLIVCGVLVIERQRLVKEQKTIFAERDAYRLAYALYKAECDRNGLHVDTTALQALPIVPAP
jgi:hypothetical protein